MPLSLYKRGEIYHYRGTLGGGESDAPATRLRGTTGTAKKDLAQQYINDIERQFWKSHRDGPESVLTFARAAIEYRKMGKPDRFLDAVENYWKETMVRYINGGNVRKGAVTVFPNVSNATRNRQFIVPTMAVINHAASMDLCPALRVKRFPEVRKEKVPATLEWVEAFMAASSPYMGALCCFLFLTGTRISDALAVTWQDVDLSEGKVWVTQGKLGGDRRRVHMPPMLVAAIANIASNRQDDVQVFPYSHPSSARNVWLAVVDRAGIAPLTFHSCRHGFATAMIRAGVDVITTAKLGGWKSPDHVFRTYGHASDDETLSNLISGTPKTQGVVVHAKKIYKSKS